MLLGASLVNMVTPKAHEMMFKPALINYGLAQQRSSTS